MPDIDVRWSTGPMQRVATARNQAEAEMIEALLRAEGIPSLVQRSGGADVPDFLAAGSRDIMVPASGAALAREILGSGDVPDEPATAAPLEGTPAWVKALAVAMTVAILAVIAAGVFAALD